MPGPPGIRSFAGRLSKKMQAVHEQYEMLHSGLENCRGLNPLVYDLEVCGTRADCADGQKASQQPLYDFFRHVQLQFGCGGFCTRAVPLFGPATMRDTIIEKEACAVGIASSVHFFGQFFSVSAVSLAVPVGVAALVLICAAEQIEDEFEEVPGSDVDDGEHLGHQGSAY